MIFKTVNEKRLYEALLNMIGAFDTPVRRLKFPSDFGDEACKIARETIENTISKPIGAIEAVEVDKGIKTKAAPGFNFSGE